MNQDLYNFNTGTISIPYKLINSSKSKHIRITMGPDGMKVSKPKRVKLSEVERMLNSKANWICKHYLEFQSMKVDGLKREWHSGESIQYMGSECSIIVHEYEKLRTKVSINGTVFEVFVNKQLSDEQRKDSIESELKKCFVKAARETIEERLEFFCSKTGLAYNQFRIKEQKTRWGSCSKKGNLNFNWKLIMAPLWVIDYVVLHEVCHLRYMNHSKDFWNMVGLYIPEYKKAKQWLKKNGIRLNI